MKNEELIDIIKSYDGPKLRIMEVCGTHTHEIFRLGIRQVLPDNIELISGPGCPVCVTPVAFIDEAIMLALEKGCTVCTFGDLIRVPGSEMSLAGARAQGGKIDIVYSPMDAESYAAAHRDEQVVFLSVGFETTTPASCIAVSMAEKDGIDNFSLLTANKTMPKAYEMLKDYVDVYLYPGHVNAIMGNSECIELAKRGVSGVVSGFTANEILSALAAAVIKVREGKPFFVNAYPRVVTDEGSPAAKSIMNKYMEAYDCEWRGLGIIPGSGRRLKDEYAAYDARKKYALPKISGKVNKACRCGEVLQGLIKPSDCPCFGTACVPAHPVGACMVSGEGACSAYYQYGGEL
jgi:hydrogenase expression/formation protein HypD